MTKAYAWRTGRYCVYKNFVHLIFVTKYRRGVFTKKMLPLLEQSFKESCIKMGGELLSFGGEDDHVHLMVCVPPNKALCHFVGRLKGASSFTIRRAYGKDIQDKLWGQHLWSPGYCAISCGGATLEVVRKYIEAQRKPSSDKGVKQSIQERGRLGNDSRVRMGKSLLA